MQRKKITFCLFRMVSLCPGLAHSHSGSILEMYKCNTDMQLMKNSVYDIGNTGICCLELFCNGHAFYNKRVIS